MSVVKKPTKKKIKADLFIKLINLSMIHFNNSDNEESLRGADNKRFKKEFLP